MPPLDRPADARGQGRRLPERPHPRPPLAPGALPDGVRAEMLLSLGGGGEGLSACANVGTSVREIIRRSQPMAGRLVMGDPPTQPGNVVRLEVFPPAVGPGLGQRPLERPAVARVPPPRRHGAGSPPPIFAAPV